MPKKKPIAPKPTQYRNILFRSVLEARTAVLLDNVPNILNWAYESKTFLLKPENWEYTPDFEINFFLSGQKQVCRMEVKPIMPTPSYMQQLEKAAKVIRPYFVCFIPDYFNQYFASVFYTNGRSSLLVLDELFDRFGYAFNRASNYRFDV